MVSVPGFKILPDSHSPSWLRLICAISITFSLIWSAKQIWDRGTFYFQRPISLFYEFREEVYVNFPSVTICSSEPFTSHDIGNYVPLDFRKRPKINLQNIWEKSGMDIYDKIVKCAWMHIDCRNRNYWTEVDTILGHCYTLSFDNMTKTKFSVTMLEQPVEIDFETPSSSEKDHSLLNILVHDKHIDVTYKVLTKGIQIPPHYFASLFYNKQMKFRAKPCLTTEMENACYASCMDKNILENSTCRMPFMKTSDFPLCNNLKTINKLYPVPIHHFEKPIDVKCSCDSACNSTHYDVHLDVESSTGTNITAVELHRSSTRPHFLVSYERQDYILNNLLCDIGATLGLFFGISILTMCEIIEYASIKATDWLNK